MPKTLVKKEMPRVRSRNRRKGERGENQQTNKSKLKNMEGGTSEIPFQQQQQQHSSDGVL
jgi:hypothetical protein